MYAAQYGSDGSDGRHYSALSSTYHTARSYSQPPPPSAYNTSPRPQHFIEQRVADRSSGPGSSLALRRHLIVRPYSSVACRTTATESRETTTQPV